MTIQVLSTHLQNGMWLMMSCLPFGKFWLLCGFHYWVYNKLYMLQKMLKKVFYIWNKHKFFYYSFWTAHCMQQWKSKLCFLVPNKQCQWFQTFSGERGKKTTMLFISENNFPPKEKLWVGVRWEHFSLIVFFIENNIRSKLNLKKLNL